MSKNIREQMRDLRRDFEFGTLDVNEVPLNPIDLFKKWLNDAVNENVKDANAFMLSTVQNDWPDARILLIRDIVEDGFHFYTNYGSKKAADIMANEKAAATIFWPELERQIRLKVKLNKLDSNLSDDYFKTRPRKSQIGAWASKQSAILDSRNTLDERLAHFDEEFKGKEVPRPEFWGGYHAKIYGFEFWQGRNSRLHDRIVYQLSNDSWEIIRLYP